MLLVRFQSPADLELRHDPPSTGENSRYCRINDLAVLQPGCGCELRRLDAVGPQQVKDRSAAGQQIIRDDSPMAAPPYGLGAHDCAAALNADLQQLGQRGGKLVRERIVSIVVEALI